jgi:tRNA (mo5U34)-methyltransferase
MHTTEIAQRIKTFPRWHYQFNLAGHVTPILAPEFVNRQRERKRYFFDPLVELYGGTLRGKRVLDLGCNAGFWSLAAIEAGCDYVLGVDGRAMHVEQADFVFEVNQVDTSRYRFDVANVFDYPFDSFETFDIVLCLGILYHVAKPFCLMEIASQVNSDLLVIDTSISELPGSFLSFTQEAPLDGDPRRAIDYRLVTYPTKMAIRDMGRALGYEVAVLKPSLVATEGMGDYRRKTRYAFLCAKRTELSALSAAVEPISALTQARDSGRWIRNRVTELIRADRHRP